MALTNQRILILDDRTGVGETTAPLTAGLGARVTLIQPTARTRLPAIPAGDHPYETVAWDVFGEPDAWREGGRPDIDHLLIGHFALPESYRAAGGEEWPWSLSGSYHWAYALVRRGRLPVRQSVALFWGPRLVPVGGGPDSISGAVEDGYVRLLAAALTPRRVNAVWTPPVRSPLGEDPAGPERQALYLGVATSRGRLAIGEDVAQALVYLMDQPALTGSIVRIDPAPVW